MTRTQQWITSAALFALLGVTLFIYWPGLNGPLLLDDIPNLNALKTIGPVDDTSSFLWFILHKSHSYPSRPLSLASFLINDTGWPLYVWMHKYTNVLIHLLNGVLVFWLALLLGRSARTRPDIVAWAALTTAALWLLAPLQVSTTLYVIQRMTQLSAMFVLCGLITYCYGRQRLNENPIAALATMTFGVVVFGALGFLSKENAVLLTLFVLVIELCLLRFHIPIRSARTNLYFSIWKWLVLVVPIVLAFAFIASRGIFDDYEYRPFTPFERIASQPRILFDYIHDLLVPMRQGMGLTHDDYILSTGWFSPPTTILAIVALAGLLLAALYTARKAPSLFSLAVLWFLCGHVLESSVLALERYWEHRNYLPAFGPFFAISFAVWTTQSRLRKFLRTVLATYGILLAVMTQQNVTIWSDHLTLGEVWAADHPRSVRAQQIRANYWSTRGYFGKADEIINRIAELRPDSMGAQVQVLLMACRTNPDDVSEAFSDVESRISSSYIDNSVVPTVKILLDIREDVCPLLTREDLLDLIEEVVQNESTRRRPDQVASLLTLKAVILAKIATPQAVVSHLYAAFQQQPTFDLGLIAVDYLYRLGEYDIALQVLNETSNLDYKAWSPVQFRYHEIEKWRKRIREKMENHNTCDSDTPGPAAC